jgi:integrase
MSLYKRGGVWWFKFKFNGATVRESTGLSSIESARDVQRNRQKELREGAAGLKRRQRPRLFSPAAETWLEAKRGTGDWAAKTAVIEATNLGHLKAVLAGKLLTDIDHEDVAAYWQKREADDAAAKTISLELGTLRAILLYNDLDSQWRAIRKRVKLKKARKVGRVITQEEETCLLQACGESRSRSLGVVIRLALQTCMRYSELRLLMWRQVDLARRTITVGESKTDTGTGREIPMTSAAHQILTLWAANFPNRKPKHYVFPAEKYGATGHKFQRFNPKVYDTDPTEPIGTWKEAWEAAKERAGVECRFHDLRHTACTHLLEAGVSMNEVADIMGWSTSTAIRMIREVYGHVGPIAKRRAMQQFENFLEIRSEGAQKGAQTGPVQEATSEDSQEEAIQ